MASGKIANLPREIREELNHRLYDGKSGSDLVEWLNSQPEVIEVLNTHFEGRQVSEQNLSEWKRHGYQQWLTLHTLLNESVGASESAETIAESGINCERLLVLLTARYADLIQRWSLIPTDQLNYKMGVFKQLTDAVLALRRAELQAVHLQLARERIELLREKKRNASSSSSPASSSGPKSTNSADNSSAENGNSSNHVRPADCGGAVTAEPPCGSRAEPLRVPCSFSVAPFDGCGDAETSPPVLIHPPLSEIANSSDLQETAERPAEQISGPSVAATAPAMPATPPLRDPRSRFSLL